MSSTSSSLPAAIASRTAMGAVSHNQALVPLDPVNRSAAIGHLLPALPIPLALVAMPSMTAPPRVARRIAGHDQRPGRMGLASVSPHRAADAVAGGNRAV